MKRMCGIVLAFVSVLSVAPSDATAQTRFLVPILVSAPGAGGSWFTSDLFVWNGNSQELVVKGVAYVCPILCPPDDPLEIVVPPLGSASGIQQSGLPGRIIETSLPNDVHFNLRVRQVEDGNFRVGADLPVVPLSAFTTETLRFLSIWNRSGFRTRLRLFAAESVDVHVRVISRGTEVVDDEIVTLEKPDDPWLPAYGETVNFPETEGHLQAEAISLDSAVPIWGLVSITKNTSQEVSIVLPK